MKRLMPGARVIVPRKGVSELMRLLTLETEQTVTLYLADAIKQALTRPSILCNEKFRGVRFQIEPNTLRISANNADQEHAEEALGVEYAGDKMEIGFNVVYLLDIVSAIATKTIRFVFTGPGDGVLIEPAEGDVGRYVVMPLRL